MAVRANQFTEEKEKKEAEADTLSEPFQHFVCDSEITGSVKRRLG